MGMTVMEPEVVSAKLRERLGARAEAEGIVAAWLFGSVARGDARSDSDVDVGILYRDAPPRTLEGVGRVYGLEEDLTADTGLPVQVVNLNQASVDLVVRVLRDGDLLVDLEPLRRIAFEVSSRNEFWDLEPYLRLYRGQSLVHS